MSKQKTVLLIGGTGFIGKLIGMHLTEQGYAIHCVGIEAPDVTLALGYPCQYFRWDGKGTLPNEAVQNVSVVINCAGCPVANGRWQPINRQAIVASRIRATEVAVDAASRAKARVLIQASSMDYYGNTGGKEVSEETAVGRGFWPEAIARWECAASALPATTRLVTLRMAEVHSIYGGRLRKRVRSYGKRIGSPTNDPQHHMTFIHSQDLVRMVESAIENERWQGAINAAAPQACSMAQLHVEFLRYFTNFTHLGIPSWLRRISTGMMLAEQDCKGFNQKVRVNKATSLGFEYHYPEIASSLASFLDHNSPDCFYHTWNQWLPATPEQLWQFFENAHNWEKLNPPNVRLKLRKGSPVIAEEGSQFHFGIYYFGLFPGTWKTQHIHRERPHRARCIVQEGSMEMLEMNQTFTAVAGGTRIDEVMRYQSPVATVFLGLSDRISSRANTHIFDYRRRKLAEFFAVQDGPSTNNERKVG